ncbi:DUF1707 SHOCT-like domain-containing protein [Amycolatopsis nigrescens]|uniref:DUF1707 SHOCT-like domain-containing protein n=1 Tax=Amycolatopsis nigrescens TaxID=381445 RepID=UPI00038137F0|nr:DUF1707 domain-containing protein [Amycolatopsis nigrescens]
MSEVSEVLEPDRHAAQARLEQAVGEGRLTLDEYVDRVDLVWHAETAEEVQRALAELPVPLHRGEHKGRMTVSAVFDDIRRRGRFALSSGDRVTAVFGDVRLDLRQAVLTEAVVRLEVSATFGDVRVTVPPGIEIEVKSFAPLGDRDIQVAQQPRVPGSPRLRLNVRTLFGDVKVRTDV